MQQKRTLSPHSHCPRFINVSVQFFQLGGKSVAVVDRLAQARLFGSATAVCVSHCPLLIGPPQDRTVRAARNKAFFRGEGGWRRSYLPLTPHSACCYDVGRTPSTHDRSRRRRCSSCSCRTKIVTERARGSRGINVFIYRPVPRLTVPTTDLQINDCAIQDLSLC